MKIIAFFNEKGGVGKSTFTLMYASQLKYKYGVKVGVADFNNRLTGYRKDEIRTMRQAEDIDESIIANAWPIVPVDRKAVAGYGPNNPGYALWLEKLIREGVETLTALTESIDTSKMKEPTFRLILTAADQYAYRREDGIFIVPVGCLKD